MPIVETPERAQNIRKISTKPIGSGLAPADAPIVFLTAGSAESLDALPDVAGFAAAAGRRLVILHLRSHPAGGDALAALAPAGPRPDVLALAPADLDAALSRIAATTGGILALLPRRPRALGRWLIGSEYERLLRAGPLPILALPASGRIARPARVLFPADLSPRSHAALDQAIALCQRLGAELHLLHVFGDDRLLPAELDLARRSAVQNPRELLAIDQAQLRELAQRAAAQGIQTSVRTAEGRAHAKVLDYASATAIDLIVLASHGPRTTEDILLGSTSVRIIHDAQVPVLAMRG